ncbi:MAG: YncE family protein [Planctomycetota bacterium]|nr:MAG: YncE family protein [Planctomycetota bacterium]
MNRRLLALAASTLPLFGLAGCGSSSGGLLDSNATSSSFFIEEVNNGFGRLLPHVVHRVDPVTGEVSPDQLVEIRTLDDLLANRPSEENPVLPPATWPTDAIVPSISQAPGNHFVVVRFSRSLDIDSILDRTAGGLSNNGLTGALQVVAYDPATGYSEQVKGRGFINGLTYYGNPPRLERWVKKDGRNHVLPVTVKRNGVSLTPGVGFPGTDIGLQDGSFQNAGNNIDRTTFVFVVDSDGDLSTFETFPENRIIRIVIDDSIRSKEGRILTDPGVATSTVGGDTGSPRPLLDGVAGTYVTEPINLAINVPCDQEIHFWFDESCQPYSVGPLPSSVPPALSNEFTVEFLPGVPEGFPPPGQTVSLPYTVMPVSPYDFTQFLVRPVVPFPGSDPNGSAAQAFITYFFNAAVDLFLNGDPNTLESHQITFEVSGECPGLVNAPVAPGAIYLASNGGGTAGGIRVLDLDGFGQGTGDPTHNYADPLYDVGDISKFPFNLNLTSPQAQNMFPPLAADPSTIAGGSAGVFTLAKDSSLSTQLVTSETVGTVADMMLGHPLDLLFNNFECLSGGQNLCASASFQSHPLNQGAIYPGNSISHAPHPNPPRIQLAPSCFAPLIMTEEPTTPLNPSVVNLLGPGDAFGQLGGQGPSGLLTTVQHYAGFYGPAPANVVCPTFTLRQQVGHLLYVLDSDSNQVVVLNSNRMTVIDRIPVADPRDLAIAPDLNLLAVSNKGTNTVTFIDTNPNSPTFHQVVKVTSLVDTINNRVGLAPSEIVWQPDDEDILVVCEDSNSMAIISSGDLEVRKIIPGVAQPRLIAVTNRDQNFGFQTGLYYAVVLAQDGSATIFESGPDGVQGIGFDDFIGIPALQGQSGFDSPTAIQPDTNSFFHGTFIAHRKNGLGAVSNLHLKDAPFGTRNLALNGFVPDPNFRSKEFAVRREYTNILSSSSVVDIALDNLSNWGGMSVITSQYASNKFINHSSKSLVRTTAGLLTVAEPQFLFVANSNGILDVVDISSGTLFVPSISVPGLQVLCDYWRQ